MKNIKKVIVLSFIYLSFILSGCESVEKADLILTNGKIITVDNKTPEAEAIAIKGDVIIAIGKASEIDKYKGEQTEIIDLQGKTAIPGLISGHAHFLGLGKLKQNIELQNTKSWEEIVGLVAEAAKKAKPGDWILGRGWHQEKWGSVVTPNVNGFPLHDLLSKASPNNPVILDHASGHAIIVNEAAMKLAGITNSTKAPLGGEIIRDKKGNAIGVFNENAESLIRSAYYQFIKNGGPQKEKEMTVDAVRLAVEECLRYGITSLHDAGAGFSEIDLFKELIDNGTIKIRLNVMVSESNENLKSKLANYKIIGYGKDHLTVRTIKRLIDGALGARTAWMLEDYSDMAGVRGLQTDSVSEFEETANIAMQNGFQMSVHCIGDRANKEILNIYEKVFAKNLDKKDLRWRIEHAQHLAVDDIPRFAKLGVIPSMQTIHCTSDAPYVYKRLGDKRAADGAYVWRKLMDAGSKICNGTDAPVESINPYENFYAAVTRKLADGSEFFPNQKMTRLEALESYTINNAFASFEEKIKGSLEVGKKADITVLSNDLLTVEEDKIKTTEALYTIVGGKIVYKK